MTNIGRVLLQTLYESVDRYTQHMTAERLSLHRHEVFGGERVVYVLPFKGRLLSETPSLADKTPLLGSDGRVQIVRLKSLLSSSSSMGSFLKGVCTPNLDAVLDEFDGRGMVAITLVIGRCLPPSVGRALQQSKTTSLPPAVYDQSSPRFFTLDPYVRRQTVFPLSDRRLLFDWRRFRYCRAPGCQKEAVPSNVVNGTPAVLFPCTTCHHHWFCLDHDQDRVQHTQHCSLAEGSSLTTTDKSVSVQTDMKQLRVARKGMVVWKEQAVDRGADKPAPRPISLGSILEQSMMTSMESLSL